jgi:hypothetical protein
VACYSLVSAFERSSWRFFSSFWLDLYFYMNSMTGCVQYVATKLPELFYYWYICILTAYWEWPLSKCSPWAAVHLGQRCCHCRKYFCNSCCGIAFSAIVTFFWMSSMSWNLRHFKA